MLWEAAPTIERAILWHPPKIGTFPLFIITNCALLVKCALFVFQKVQKKPEISGFLEHIKMYDLSFCQNMECSIIGDSFRKTPPKGTPGARPLWLYRLFFIRMDVAKPSRPMPASAQRPRQRTAQSGAARRLASAVPNPPNGHRTIAAAHKRQIGRAHV